MRNAIPILWGGIAASCVILMNGCAVAPSKTVSGAGTGAAVGAVGGAVIGNNTGSGNGAGGAAIGGLAGAVVGGIAGAIAEGKERTEQDRLAQERAYQQELAKRRAQEAKFKSAIEEELAVAEGYRISDQEINQVESKARDLESKLKELQEERQAALNRKRQLEAAQGRISAAEQELQRLEAELAELRGETRSTSSADPYVEHRVEQGESLGSIAARYKVPESMIREANDHVDFDQLVPGQTLRIPVPGVSAATSS